MFGSIRIKALCLVFLVNFSQGIRAQRIINYNLTSTGGIVRVDFDVSKGSNCDGYIIYHSLDSTFFTVIEDYAGICSSTTEDVRQTFNHTSPRPNSLNYYKVELAFIETSPIKSVYVNNESRAVLSAYPNPILLSDEILNLRTSNTENGQLEGFMCDESGHKLTELLVNCYDYIIRLPIQELESGIYFIWLTDGLLAYGTKFIVSP